MFDVIFGENVEFKHNYYEFVTGSYKYFISDSPSISLTTYFFLTKDTETIAQSVKVFASYAEGWVFESRLRQTYVVKKVVTASLLNVRQQVGVLLALGDDHNKRVSRVTVGLGVTIGVARSRTLTAH